MSYLPLAVLCAKTIGHSYLFSQLIKTDTDNVFSPTFSHQPTSCLCYEDTCNKLFRKLLFHRQSQPNQLQIANLNVNANLNFGLNFDLDLNSNFNLNLDLSFSWSLNFESQISNFKNQISVLMSKSKHSTVNFKLNLYIAVESEIQSRLTNLVEGQDMCSQVQLSQFSIFFRILLCFQTAFQNETPKSNFHILTLPIQTK